ncbi:TadE/TadG family type IV pilus assembly protein [Arenibaculum pallidiluteum]|uniref:TadE/TadG family type IV pilus assembly protein n=1 Tax=Arenibaculum pallidiluteum TaxID=2812559 RepID=UPI001A95AA44|nr:TadE/TadG family type IV pilus assembly protein [Arenibaculum pallidiluteum]
MKSREFRSRSRTSRSEHRNGLLARFAREGTGSATAEFAISAVVLAGLIAGAVDLARYVLFHQRVYHAANYLADLGSRDEAVSRSEMDAVFRTLPVEMAPFDILSTVSAEVSGLVDQQDGAPELAWKASWSPAQAPTYQVPRPAPDEDMLVSARVVARFEPLMGVLGTTTVSHSAVYRPRFGTVDFIQ